MKKRRLLHFVTKWLGIICILPLWLNSGMLRAADAPVISEGVHIVGADAWHTAGFTGKGVKIGFVDNGLEGYQDYLGSVNLTVKSFLTDPQQVEVENTAYATASVEVIHEMAPDAEIYAAVAGNGSEYYKALQWLVDDIGVDILADYKFWPSGVLDGSSSYDRLLRQVKNDGIFIVVPTQPDGSGLIGSDEYGGHYSATFRDFDNDGYHDFTPTTGGAPMNWLPLKVVDTNPTITKATGVSQPQKVYMNLFWDGDSATKMVYTLTIEDQSGREVARALPFDSHTRYLQALSASLRPGDYRLRLKTTQVDGPYPSFDIFFNGVQAGQVVPAGAFHVPQDANDVVTVGPANWKDDRIPPYAVHGPTQDGRTKPDLVAPDCVSGPMNADTRYAIRYRLPRNTLTCGMVSAAHVAGAAALYLQAHPDATPDEILAYFQQNAVKLSGMDGDPNASGAGRLRLGPPPG